MTTYLVGYTGTVSAGQVKVAALSAVVWSNLNAGDSVLIYPGVYSGVTTMLGAVGTVLNPIIVTAIDPTQPPVLTDSLDIQSSRYVQVSHLKVQNATYAGIILRNGSDHIVVADNEIVNGPLGINLTGGAGTGHRILRNTIVGVTGDGIGVDGVNCSAGDPTLIVANTITACGVHGMEIRGSNYRIEYNDVFNNGLLSGGTSGIHVYAYVAGDGTGQNNTVRYNNCWRQNDTTESDGNGIQIDQFCNGNLVAYNVCWSNDGAGVIVYDGSNNIVRNNTVQGNGLNPTGTHGGLGQIIVNGTLASNVVGNVVYNNLCISSLGSVPALYIDPYAVAGGVTVGPNLLQAASGGHALRWTDSAFYDTASAINAVTGSAGNAVETAMIVGLATRYAHGLRLVSKPSSLGTFPTGEFDLLGQPAQAGQCSFGAYYLY